MTQPTTNRFLDFTIILLLVSNIWIILYLHLLTVFNFFYPPQVSELFYRASSAAPEPFEIPLFLILSHVFILAIILLRNKVQQIANVKIATAVKLMAVIILLLVFITKIGAYPLGLLHYPYEPRSNTFLYTLIPFLYLFSISMGIAEIIILNKLSKTMRFGRLLIYGAVIGIIGVLIFEPRFPIGTHEYAYFFGPLYEVLGGKTLFTQVQSNYGFYSILFFAALAKLGLFTYSHLPIYIYLLYVVQYFLCFYIVYKLSRSLVLGLIALFSIITLNYFSMFVLPITLTQYSAIRRLPAVLLIFLALRSKKVNSPVVMMAASLTSFFVIDAGIQTYLAVGSTLFLLFLSKSIKWREFIVSGLILIGSLFAMFSAINGLHLVFGYQPINYLLILQTLRDHAINGLVMVPLVTHTYFWIVMLIYFASILSWIKTKNHLLLFAAQLSLFTALYFVGRSDDTNLFDISVIVLLNFFMLLGSALSHLKMNAQQKMILYSLLFIIFIVYPVYMRRFTLTELLIEKYERMKLGQIFEPEMNQALIKRFKEEQQLITSHIKDPETLILARDDTYLFMLTGKRNLLDTNPESAIETGSSMQFALKQAIKSCPATIAVECMIYKKCPDFTPYVVKSDLMAGHIIKEIETACNIVYKPRACTKQLCIAEAE